MCHLHLEAVALNPHHAGKGALHAGETDDCLAFQTKQIHQRYNRNIRSGQINSLVRSEKKERTGELSNINIKAH